MPRDHLIHILLCASGIAAGIALMAAPEVLTISSPGMSYTCFSGGVTLTLLLFGAAIFVAARGEKNRPQALKRRRMLPLIGMILFGCGFIVCAAWYFWPALPSQTARGSSPGPELTIENLWRDDFTIGSYKMLQDFSIDLFKEGGQKLGTFEIGVGMYGDFAAKSLFMSLYVPGSDHGYDVIGWFAGLQKVIKITCLMLVKIFICGRHRKAINRSH
jgi:hypothetical protein